MFIVVTSVSLNYPAIRRRANRMRPGRVEDVKRLPHKLQADDADRLLGLYKEAKAHYGNFDFLVPTGGCEAELVILRLLRRVREGQLPADELIVRVFTASGAMSECRVDKDGEFIDVWPEGFFDARCAELY